MRDRLSLSYHTLSEKVDVLRSPVSSPFLRSHRIVKYELLSKAHGGFVAFSKEGWNINTDLGGML